nr:hypothetical protein [uncultured Olsenella sp.]
MKASCKVKVGAFRWSRPGYAETMNAAGVQGLLADKADAMAGMCNATFVQKGNEGPGYGTKKARGKLANGRVVTTVSRHGLASELRHNRLASVLGGA